MDDALAPLDRRTLAFWRGSNLAGWATAGLGTALVLHWIAARYSERYFGHAALNYKWEWFTGWFILPSLGYRLGIALVIGTAIGLIVGRHVWTRPVAIASGVALTYAMIAIFMIIVYVGPITTHRAGPAQVLVTQHTVAHGLGGNGVAGWIHDLLTLATVPVAAFVARFTARRRPGN